MKKGNYFLKNLLLLIPIFLVITSCDDPLKPPVVETCVIGFDGLVKLSENEAVSFHNCICFDPRIEDEPRIEPIEYCLNYIATSPADYDILYKWFMDKLEKYEKCRLKCKQCD